MIRPVPLWKQFRKEYNIAEIELELFCGYCALFLEDLERLMGSTALPLIGYIRQQFYEIEMLKNKLDKKILELRKFGTPNRNFWITERAEINQIYFIALKKMLAAQALFRSFILAHQPDAFPVTHVHEMNSYEKLLCDFRTGNLNLAGLTKTRQ